jgi:plasmid maintenance system antidote protein VapI
MCEVSVVTSASFPSEPTDLAKVLVAKAKVSSSYASELANGVRKPSLKMAIKLQRVCGIPASFWIEREEAA